MSDPLPTPEATAPDFSSLQAAVQQRNAQQQQQAPVEQPATPVEQKPAPQQPKEPVAPKKPWEVSAQEKEAPAPPAEEPKIEEPPVEMKPEAKTRWGQLRKTEEEYKRIAPEYEKLKAEVEQLRTAEPKLPEELKTELEELRQFRAAYDVENTPEFIKAVVEPYTQVETELKQVADYAQIPLEDLMKAVEEPNRLKRNAAIRGVLSKSPADITESEIQLVNGEADKAHSIFQKATDLRKQATEIRSAMTGTQKAQAEAQQRQIEAAYSKAVGEMSNTLTTSLKHSGVLNAEVTKAIQEAKQASIAEDPQMAAYQAQAGVLLPHMIELLNKERQELREARAALAARSKASPSVTTNGSGEPPKKEMSSEEALSELGNLIRARNGNSW